MLGNVQMTGVTENTQFFQLLKDQKWDVVAFAPGACRFSAARQTIPGGDETTKQWTLTEYKAKVQELQGDGVRIVEAIHPPRFLAGSCDGMPHAGAHRVERPLEQAAWPMRFQTFHNAE